MPHRYSLSNPPLRFKAWLTACSRKLLQVLSKQEYLGGPEHPLLTRLQQVWKTPSRAGIFLHLVHQHGSRVFSQSSEAQSLNQEEQKWLNAYRGFQHEIFQNSDDHGSIRQSYSNFSSRSGIFLKLPFLHLKASQEFFSKHFNKTLAASKAFCDGTELQAILQKNSRNNWKDVNIFLNSNAQKFLEDVYFWLPQRPALPPLASG